MDRARDFHFVKQLPRGNVPEVDYSDAVYDRQTLLNETWHHYCARVGYPAERGGEEHVKWVTETWEEWEMRVPQRTAALEGYFDAERHAKAQQDADAAEKKKRADATIAKLMKQEEKAAAGRKDVVHTLYVDFAEELRKKHERERADSEAAEQEARRQREQEEAEARNALQKTALEDRARVQAILDERRRLQEEEEARIREEQRQKAEALRKVEEEKKRAAEEAERKRREEEEEAKRAERRRKDEERRAKAKAEREARAGGRKKDTSNQKEDQRTQSRNARLARMETEMSEYLTALKPRCDAVATETDFQTLLKEVTNELGGKLLFHTAVYMGVPKAAEDPTTPTAELAYPYASENCSQKLKSGAAALCRNTAEADGIVPLVIESCFDKVKGTGIVRGANKSLVNIGDWPEMGVGDFAASPVVVQSTATGEDGTTTTTRAVAALCFDTLSSNTPDSTLAGGAGEEHCYLPADNDAFTPVAMPASQGTFQEKVAELLSGAATRAATPGGATDATAVDKETTEAKEEAAAPTHGVPSLNLPDSIDSIPSLFSFVSSFVHNSVPAGDGNKAQCYISRFLKPDGAECTVVSHNGVALSDPTRHTSQVPCHLLGNTLSNTASVTMSALVGSANADTTHVYVPNVAEDDRCVPYVSGTAKEAECLLLIPLRDAKGRVVAVVGISAPQPPGLTAEQIEAILTAMKQVQAKLLTLLLHLHAATVCSQACEWLELTTGASNIYVSLKDPQNAGTETADDLTYVAASSGQQWMVGKQLGASEEKGISHGLLRAPNAPEMVPCSIPSIAGYQQPDTNAHVHRFNDATKEADGALVACTIAHSTDVFGIVYADTVNSSGKKPKTSFTKSDEQLIQTTATLLASLLKDIFFNRGATPAGADDAIAKRVLSIEELVGLEQIEFLKKVWIKVTNDIQGITKDQLLEMSRYNQPPPIIPVTVGATFIVLGTKPKSVEQWEDSRKKIKMPMLEKIIAFDPTATKVKKAFFLRSKKMTKGYTADDVFTKGSYPASCFFTWTFVTILLRKSADAIRKRVKNGDIDVPGAPTETESMATEDMAGDDGEGAEAGEDEGEDLPEEPEEEA